MFNQSALKPQLLTEFLALFNSALDNETFGKLVMRIMTQTEQADLNSIGDVGQVQDLRLGDLIIRTLGLDTFTVKTVPYGNGVRIPRHLLKNSMAKEQITALIGVFAQKQADHVNKLCIDKLAEMLTDTCLDGTAFFNASHPILGGTQSNLLTDAPVNVVDRTAPTLNEMGDKIFNKLRLALQGMKSDTGEPLNPRIQEFVWFVPYQWEHTAKALFDPSVSVYPTGAAGVPNVYRSYKVNVVGNGQQPQIASTQPTYLMAMGPGIRKPLAYAEYIAPEMDQETEITSGRPSEVYVTNGQYTVAGLHYQSAVCAKVGNL